MPLLLMVLAVIKSVTATLLKLLLALRLSLLHTRSSYTDISLNLAGGLVVYTSGSTANLYASCCFGCQR